MAQAFTPGLAAHRSCTLRRVRELPVAGELLVGVGDPVEALQIIARANLDGDLEILRIAEKLGIEPFEVVKGLKVKEGDSISLNQLLCEHSGIFGLFRSRFLSPVAGILELINQKTGHLAIRGAKKPVEIDGYMQGKVVAVQHEKSVTVETNAAFVQGIFGVGGESRGTLRVIRDIIKRLEPEHLPKDLRGVVLLSTAAPSIETLSVAAKNGVRGLIVGSIDDKVLASYLGYDLGIALTGDEVVPFTLVLTEGFGDLPMSARTFDLLSEFDGAGVSINGATQVRAGAIRPEIIIPHPFVASADRHNSGGLVVGASIRIIRVPFFGLYAEVVELPKEMQKIETGAHARVLRARLASGDIVTVPRANVELV